MATYIEPNSEVQLFKGINLDNRYLHTIEFHATTSGNVTTSAEQNQNAWFSNKPRLTFSNQLYRRNTSNSIKVQYNAQLLLGYTYMRFKNKRSFVSDGGVIDPAPVPADTTGATEYSKWFYAFINAIDYVNETTAIIYYEIDVMQTWFIPNGNVRPCMILREHVNDDTIFSHLEAEPIGSEEYDYDYLGDCDTITGADEQPKSNVFLNYDVYITTTGKDSSGYYELGLFDGTHHASIACNNSTQANDVASYLDGLLGSWDSGMQQQEVLSMHTFPSYFAQLSSNLYEDSKKITGFSGIGGYTPKNNKLYCYPYSYLYCTTHNGNNNFYKWEYFTNSPSTNKIISDKTFGLLGSPLGGGQIKCYPKNYGGKTNDFENGVSMSDFPKNAFNYDAYQAWVANGGKTKLQNDEAITGIRNASAGLKAGTDFATGVIGGFINTGVGAVETMETGGLIGFNRMTHGIQQMSGGVQSLLNGAADIKEAQNKISYQWKDAAYRPNIPVGASDPCVMVGYRALNFYFYNCHVKTNELQKIDDFFTCYGYAVNRIKTPNITGRQYWNFVQTDKCEIGGDMPSSSKEAIGRIFDGGITFWHVDSEGNVDVGNYRSSNPIVS